MNPPAHPEKELRTIRRAIQLANGMPAEGEEGPPRLRYGLFDLRLRRCLATAPKELTLHRLAAKLQMPMGCHEVREVGAWE